MSTTVAMGNVHFAFIPFRSLGETTMEVLFAAMHGFLGGRVSSGELHT